MHGKRAARRAVGLGAALIDHGTMTVSGTESLGYALARNHESAGQPPCSAKPASSVSDRARGSDRIEDKDASDVVRLMQMTDPSVVGVTFTMLCADPVAGDASTKALSTSTSYSAAGTSGDRVGVASLRTGMPEARVQALCVAYVGTLAKAVESA